MIITRLTGGLGNQMFQYAAGLALAQRRQTILKLDVSWFGEVEGRESHGRYSLGCFNICEQFATRDEVNYFLARSSNREQQLYFRLRRLLGHGIVSRRHVAKEPFFYPEFDNLPDLTYLEGNWQDERFFADAAQLLRRHFSFRYPLPASTQPLAEQIANDPSAVMVHFRRGDYVTTKANPYCRPLELDYYRRAIEKVSAHVPQPSLYIFSDDIERIAEEFKPEQKHLFVKPAEDWQPFDELRLMSNCRHSIIANSTFSWWAAWLNSNPDKTVIAPDPWFHSDELDGSKIVPATWIRVAARHFQMDNELSRRQSSLDNPF